MAAIPDVKIRLIVDNGQLRAGLAGASADMRRFTSETQTGARGASAAMNDLGSSMNGMQSGLDTLRGVVETYLSLTGLKAIIGTLLQTQLRLQEITYGLEAAAGSARAGGEEFEYLSELAERVGVRLLDAGNAYAGYYTAAKAANLTTAESRDLFTSVAEAGAVFNLSQGKMQSAMIALQQMMALGTIRAQELNYQLGQAIPGSAAKFKQAVEEKLGKGTFSKALSEGALDVKTYGPLLSKAIQGLYNDDVLGKAAGDLNSTLAKMENSIVRFKSSLSSGLFSETISASLQELTKIVDFLTGSNEQLEKAQKHLERIQQKGQEAIDSGELKAAQEAVKDSAGIGSLITTYGLITAGVIALTRALNFGITQILSMGKALVLKANAGKIAAQATLASASAIAVETAAIVANTEVQALNLAANVVTLGTNQRVAVSELAKAEATAIAARANVSQTVTAAELAAAEFALTVAIDREIAATGLLSAAKAEQIIIETRLTGAKVLSAEAAAALALANQGAAVKTGLLATAGRGLFALMGGLPGILVGAGLALLYFGFKATETEEKIAALGKETEATLEVLKKMAGLSSDIAFAQQQLDKAIAGGVKEEIDRARETLDSLRGGVGQSLAEGQNAYEEALQKTLRAEKAVRDGLAKEQAIRDKIAKLPGGGITSVNRAGVLVTTQERRLLDQQLQEQTALRKASEKQVRDYTAGLNSKEMQQSKADLQTMESDRLASLARLGSAEETLAIATAAKVALAKAVLEKKSVKEQREAFVDAGLVAYQNSANFKGITGETPEAEKARTFAINERRAALTLAAQAEIADAKATKENSKTKKDAADALRELERVQDDTTRSIERMTDATIDEQTSQEDLEAELKGIPQPYIQAKRKLEDFNRSMQEQIAVINASKTPTDEKLAQINALTEAYAALKVEVNKSAEAQVKADQEAVLKITAEDLQFAKEDATNESLSKSLNPSDRDQAQLNQINQSFAARRAELAQAFTNEAGIVDTANARYIQALTNLEAEQAIVVNRMVTDAERVGDAFEQSLAGGFSSTITGMLTGALTLQQGLAQIFQTILTNFMQKMVAEPLAASAARWVREVLIGKAATTALTGVQAAGAAAGTAAAVAADDTKLVSTAGVTAAKAGESQANIPYIGPVLAAAAIIAMLALVLGLRNKTKKAEGGMINGPGTGTSDSIPAWLSDGEFVVKQSSVNKYGSGMLNAINQGKWVPGPRAPKFAEGGMVSRFAAAGDAAIAPPAAAPSAGGGTRVVNVIDPSMFDDYVNTASGEKTILNIIGKNPRKVKSMLGG